MKCGHLSTKDGTNAGFGPSCAVGHVKLWLLSSVIAARQPVVHFGAKSHRSIGLVEATAISGKPIHLSFQQKHTSVLAKGADRQTTWSVGITPSGNRALVSLEKHYPFQNRMQCTKSSQGFLSFVTTYHSFLNHYLTNRSYCCLRIGL